MAAEESTMDQASKSTSPAQGQLPRLTAGAEDIETIPFCTSACIGSIANGTSGDPSCPNAAVHEQHRDSRPSVSVFRDLARSSVALPRVRGGLECDTEDEPRFAGNPTANASYTSRFGATAVIFKVRVDPGGYVLVAKAARSFEEYMGMDTVRGLKREERVYRKLRALQGNTIPFCLGLVHGNSCNFHHNTFAHFPAYLLLSWAGTPLLDRQRQMTAEIDKDIDAWFAGVRTDVESKLRKLHDLGILHQDAEIRNFVVSGSFSIMIVDFERSITKGHFSRQATRNDTRSDEELDVGFGRLCQREIGHCLTELDRWKQNSVRT